MKDIFLLTISVLLAGCMSSVVEVGTYHILGGYNTGGATLQPRYNDVCVYSLRSRKDTVDFVVGDTSRVKKPVFLFLQGSLPVPVIRDDGEEMFHNGYSTSLMASHFWMLDSVITTDFHIVEISYPYTPVIADAAMLDEHAAYRPDDKDKPYHIGWRMRNHADTYTDRACAVIDNLARQEWVDRDSIFVYGHSMGGYIAPLVAHKNKHVTAVGISGMGPMGVVPNTILTARVQAMEGKITESEARTLIQQEYNNWLYCRDSTDAESLARGTTGLLPSGWKSLSMPQMDLIADLKQPVFIAYGTKDYISLPCEWLPLYFINRRKTNYCIRAYPGGHNFECQDEDGYHNRETKIRSWHRVTADFVKFVRRTTY